MKKISKKFTNDLNRPNLSDRILSKTILRFIPKSVTPNQITITRFVMVPFVFYFLYTEHYWIGFILFIIASITDALDGALAWTTNQVTEWGQSYDPVADKLLIGSVAILIVSKYISIYMTVGILAVEAMILANALYKIYVEKKSRKGLQAKLSGKIKMILQSVAIILLIINILFPSQLLIYISTALLTISIFFGVVSLLVYRSL